MDEAPNHSDVFLRCQALANRICSPRMGCHALRRGHAGGCQDANLWQRIERKTHSQKRASTALPPLLCPTLRQSRSSLCPGSEANRVAGQPGTGLNPAGNTSSASRRLLNLPPLEGRNAQGPSMEIVVSPPMVHHVEHTAQKEIPRQQPSAAEEDLYPPCVIEEEILPSTTKESEMNQDTPPPTHEGTGAGTAKQPAQTQRGNRARRPRTRRNR
jgi:hypothetical protein